MFTGSADASPPPTRAAVRHVLGISLLRTASRKISPWTEFASRKTSPSGVGVVAVVGSTVRDGTHDRRKTKIVDMVNDWQPAMLTPSTTSALFEIPATRYMPDFKLPPTSTTRHGDRRALPSTACIVQPTMPSRRLTAAASAGTPPPQAPRSTTPQNRYPSRARSSPCSRAVPRRSSTPFRASARSR